MASFMNGRYLLTTSWFLAYFGRIVMLALNVINFGVFEESNTNLLDLFVIENMLW